MNWAAVLQSLVDGLVQGSLYAIIALGYTMVYGILLMINFAHGEVLMVGAYAGTLVITGLVAGGAAATLGILPALVLALLFAMVVAGAHGVLLERLAYRPLRGAHQLAPLISAIGMSIVLQNYVRLSQGSTPKSVPANTPEFREFFGARGISLGGAEMRPLDIFIIVLSVAVMAALYAFVQRTRLGKAMRATSQDRTMAGLVGIDVNRVVSVTFAIGSMLAAVAGVLLLLYNGQARFTMGFVPGMKAFTAAVLGGIGNVRGAMLGGLVLGLAEAAGVYFLNADYKEVYALVVLLAVLIVRPRGLLGERVAEKV
jgi:branched-chain amino acid transport system permease protein